VRFSGEIQKLSPAFVTIYGQSDSAEQEALTEICGVGYRKALEFLIKDYLIEKHSDKADEIKKKFLGRCIEEYVTEVRVKEVAKRAVWLGNDETHYVRLWEGKDLKDLKDLINLTVLWIDMEKKTEQLKASMPEPSKH